MFYSFYLIIYFSEIHQISFKTTSNEISLRQYKYLLPKKKENITFLAIYYCYYFFYKISFSSLNKKRLKALINKDIGSPLIITVSVNKKFKMLLYILIFIRFINAMSKYNTDCSEEMKSISDIFPIEVDLPATLMTHSDSFENDDEDDESNTGNAGGKQQSDSQDVDLIGIN